MDWANRIEKLKAIIQNSPGRAAILTSHVDMDSISCLCGAEKFVESLGKASDLYHGDATTKFEERDLQEQTVINLFDLNRKLLPIDHFVKKGRHEGIVILVDCPSFKDSRFGTEVKDIRPTIVIDHHEIPESFPQEDENTWFWVQSSGACSAMIGKLLLDFNVHFEKPDDVATLGCIGILGDTDRLIKPQTSDLEREMIYALGKYSNQQLVYEIYSSTMDERYLDMLHTASALENRKRESNMFLTGLNEIAPEMENYAARIADLLVKIKGVTIVYVWAVVGHRLKIKVRSTDPTISLNRHLKTIFGDNGGAKHGAGAVDIDLGPLGESDDRDYLLREVKKYVHKKLLH